MQLLAQVSRRQPGKARKTGCGHALAVDTMTAQTGHCGRVLPTLAEDFLTVCSVDGGD
ncbi:hypothetical protein D3C72_1745730 [compost metagenome]